MQTTARFYLERMRDQIDQARRHRYPAVSDAPAKWLNLIAGKLMGVQQRLSEYQDDREKAEALLVDIYRCYDDLQTLGRADTSYVAEYVVSALYRWFIRTDPDCDYLFASGINFEVAPLYEGPRPFFHDDERRAQELMKTVLYRITMPGGALGAAFHIPLVTHEVGHVLISKLERDNEDKPIAEICEKDSSDEIYKEWVKEIVADTICGVIAGPAGYFALYEKLRGFGDKPDEEYPHNYIRLSSLNEYIRNQFGAVFEGRKVNEAANWETWKTWSETELFALDYMGVNRFEEEVDYTEKSHQLIKAVPKIREAALELARKHIGDLEYTPQRMEKDLNDHLELFFNAIPPFETPEDIRTRKPTDLASILNIGWFVAAFAMDQLKITASDGSKETGPMLVCLDQIILKAIELSEIRRSWVIA